MAKVFPLELRADVVAVARRGEAPIAKDFGVLESSELWELKRRNRLLEQEVEVLRKATAYLSQGMLPK